MEYGAGRGFTVTSEDGTYQKALNFDKSQVEEGLIPVVYLEIEEQYLLANTKYIMP